MHTKKVRFSVIYSNIEEATRMLNPLEINKDFSTKTFFSQGPTRSLFGCRRCNLCRRERNICFIAVRFARLHFQVVIYLNSNSKTHFSCMTNSNNSLLFCNSSLARWHNLWEMVVTKFMQENDSQRKVWITAFIILLLRSCLTTDERNRWSASQLREHSFLTSFIYGSLAHGQQEVGKNSGKAGDDGPSHLVDQPEREEPVPDFSYTSREFLDNPE